MKRNYFLGILFIIIAINVGCKRDEQNLKDSIGKTSQNDKTIQYNVLCWDKIYPFINMLPKGEREIFCEYTFSESHQQYKKEPSHCHLHINTSPNTFYMDNSNSLKIMIEDSCEYDYSNCHSFHIKRFAHASYPNLDGSYSHFTKKINEYTLVPNQYDPIIISSPYASECNPIPLCYYHNMQVLWNEAPQNEYGVGVIVEWNGTMMLDTAVNARVIGIDIVDDLGSVVVNSAIFDGIPHGALVNMWLFRLDMAAIQLEDDLEYSIGEMLLHDGEMLHDIIESDSEFMLSLSSIIAINGSVALLPMFLVRNI